MSLSQYSHYTLKSFEEGRKHEILGIKMLLKYKSLPFGAQMKGGPGTRKYSSRCPRRTLPQ